MNLSTQPERERAWVEVRLDALVANARTVAQATGVPLLPMVKANGYGLGMLPVVEALESINPWGWGVATPTEGIALRASGTSLPIVVFTPGQLSWFSSCRAHGLQPALGSVTALAEWQRQGGGAFHLEIDTGMRRAGIAWDRLAEVRPPLLDGCVGAFTHFACADESKVQTETQRRRFDAALSQLPRRVELVHAANSAAAFRGAAYAYDLVRPGIFLYGGRPGEHAPEPRPVATVRARVVHALELDAGEPVSYGWRWRSDAPTTVVTLGIGYADGVPRSVEGRGLVWLNGERLPIVGAVNMDMTLVRADRTSAAVGDVATLFGDSITVDEWATWACTSAYEALTRLGPRLPREYR